MDNTKFLPHGMCYLVNFWMSRKKARIYPYLMLCVQIDYKWNIMLNIKRNRENISNKILVGKSKIDFIYLLLLLLLFLQKNIYFFSSSFTFAEKSLNMLQPYPNLMKEKLQSWFRKKKKIKEFIPSSFQTGYSTTEQECILLKNTTAFYIGHDSLNNYNSDIKEKNG